jgi:phosphonate transport system permease protein
VFRSGVLVLTRHAIIGFLQQQWVRLLMCGEAGAAVWAVAIVVAIMDYASAKVREKVV